MTRRRCSTRASGPACWPGRGDCGRSTGRRWCTVIQSIAALIATEPRIAEIDVNPLIASGPDIVAVDALVILH